MTCLEKLRHMQKAISCRHFGTGKHVSYFIDPGVEIYFVNGNQRGIGK